MKQRKPTALWAAALAVTLLLCACGGGDKPPTAERFAAYAEQAGYQVLDASAQYAGEELTTALFASASGFQADFYVYTNPDLALSAYLSTRASLEEMQVDGAHATGTAGEGPGHYFLTTPEGFYAVSCRDNTMLYTAAPADRKEEAAAIFRDLGYGDQSI